MNVTLAMEAILGLQTQGDTRRMLEAANTVRTYIEEVPGFGKLKPDEVLLCRYEGGPQGESTVFYWRDSTPLSQEFVAKLSESHPFRRIGPGRAACPANAFEAVP